MMVDPARAKGQHDHQGTTYFFCAAACRARFVADPLRYLAPDYRPAGMGGGLVSLGKPRMIRTATVPAPAPARAPASGGPRYV
jgi:YHS domain-containing protein